MTADLPRPPGAPGPDEEAWRWARGLTAARIGLARAGASLATRPVLEFRLAHARARDAVHQALDHGPLLERLAELGAPAVLLESAATDRETYLMRPDLGRRLAPEAEERLRTLALSAAADLAVVVADGLSARAVERHAVPVLAQLLPALRAEAWRIAPLCLVRHGRVAIGDAVAAALGTTAVLVLIGERPGLSAPDSMGAYMTWRPRPGTTDAERNCISNIRPDGLGYGEAAYRIAFLFGRMRASNASGVALKDESGGTPAITGPIT